MNMMNEYDEYIMGTYKRFPICLSHGKGVYVWDFEGKKYLDFAAGIAVNCLGHGSQRIIDAIVSQSEKLIHCSNLYYTKPQLTLAKLLIDNTSFDKVFFCNSGAESIEGALKLSRKYAAKKGKDANQIIAMEGSFHGRTYGAITATGQPKYQEGLAPLLPGILHVPFNDFNALSNAVTDKTCAILLEPIQGEGGIHPAGQDYLHQVRELCDKKDILLIFDEVQTGIGRTGKLFACESYGICPDILVTAKGLAGGLPMGAILAKNQVAESFQPGDHAATFGGNPLCAAAATAVLTELTCGRLMENVSIMGEYLKSKLEILKNKHSVIKEVRGMGLMLGIALSTDTALVVKSCMEKGLLLVGAGADAIRFVPPLIVGKEEVDEAVSMLDDALKEVGIDSL